MQFKILIEGDSARAVDKMSHILLERLRGNVTTSSGPVPLAKKKSDLLGSEAALLCPRQTIAEDITVHSRLVIFEGLDKDFLDTLSTIVIPQTINITYQH
jgi:ribosomal protein S10